MHKLPTVKVVLPGNPRGYKIINESDLSPDDELFVEEKDTGGKEKTKENKKNKDSSK